MACTCTPTKPVSQEPIANVVSGYVLRDGQLYLTVKCEDGVYRDITIEQKKH